MAYKVLPDGSIVADTLEEALELQREIAKKRASQPRSSFYDLSRDDRVKTWVRVIVDSGEEGIETPDLARRLGLPQPRSCTPLMQGFENRVAQIDPQLDPKTLIHYKRRSGLPTRWNAVDVPRLRELGFLD